MTMCIKMNTSVRSSTHEQNGDELSKGAHPVISVQP